jgi:hypothetical protein
MKNKITQLGPVQNAWLNNLKNKPHAQMINRLGKLTDGVGNYEACALGEFHLTYHRFHSLPLPIDERGNVISSNGDFKVLTEGKDYGFHTNIGALLEPVEVRGVMFHSVTALNDAGISWGEIAEYIRINPSNVFYKSV